MAHKILVKIKDGKVTIEVDGIQGQSCTVVTEKLEEMLGNVRSRNEKPEYFNTEVATVKQNIYY